MPLFNAVKGITNLKKEQETDPDAIYKEVGDLDVVRGGAGELTGANKEIEQASKEAGTMDRLALEAKAMAAEQAGNLQEAADIRAGFLEEGFSSAQAQQGRWRGIGDASRGAYQSGIMGQPTEFGTEAGTQMMGQALAGQAPMDERLSQYSQQAINPNLIQGASQQASGMAGELDTRALNQQGLSSELMQQASTAPQSQYFDQAAEAAMNRPSRLEDIEGYGLMQQARDEALQASGQQFAGGGKFYSGSRMKEAGNIGAREAQGLIAQDDMRRQQQVQNLMGLGAQDVAMTQQGLQNRMGAEGQQFGMGQQQFQNLAGREQAGIGLQQQNFQNQVGVQSMQDQRNQQEFQNLMGVQGMQNQIGQQGFQNLATANQMGMGMQQMNYGAQQSQLDRQRDLMQFGYGVDQSAGDLAIQRGQQLGASGYGSAQDQANLMMGGQASSTALQQAGSGYRMGGAAAEGAVMTDLLEFGGKLAGGVMGGGGGGQQSGGVNYGGGYSNDNYLR